MLVIKKDYEKITKGILNSKVENLIMFGDETDEMNCVLSDVFNMFELHDEYLKKGMYDEFNPLDHIIKCNEDGSTLSEVDKLNATLLAVIPYSKGYGNDSYQKVANLFFNIKVVTTDFSSASRSIKDVGTFFSDFKGYSSIDDITEHTKKLFTFEKGSASSRSSSSSIPFIASNIRSVLSDLTIGHALLLGKEKVEDIPINHITFPFIKTISHFDKMIKSTTDQNALASKTFVDKHSETTKSARMRSFGQIRKVKGRQLVNPNLIVDIAKGNVNIREGVGFEKPKQIIISALDASGSMQCVVKKNHVRAVYLDILSKVIQGEVELEFYTYGATIDSVSFKADSKDKAKEVFDYIEHLIPDHNGTDIGGIVQRLIDSALERGLKEPHVVIVLDGDDKVNPDKVELKGVKVSAIILGTENQGVAELTKRSGGFLTLHRIYEKYGR